MPVLQKLGQSLMLPLAVMPAAGLLNRFGSADMLNIPILMNAGAAIINNLGMLFAVAVALGFAEESGVAALAGAVGYFVTIGVAQGFEASIDIGVFGGIVIGLIAGVLYNKFHDFKVPEVLAFFGGKRFVPIITSLAAVVLGIFFGFTWPAIQNALNNFGAWLISLGSIGPTIFMIINRLLLPFGLHHIPNNYVFFQLGSFVGADGATITGEISRFFSGDPTAGAFLVGFFPIMMGGYPGAAIAMARAAKPEKRKVITSMMISLALTSFITGITEPIEFSYTFVAPLLFIVNIILSAISALVCNILGLTAGFTFSAGFIDYVLGFGLSKNPIVLFILCIIYFFVFYFIFKFLITKFNLPTPGREEE